MMGRTRKHNKDLPQRVYLRRGKYYFVDTDGKWHPLGATRKEMYINLAKFSIEMPTPRLMKHLFDRYEVEAIPKKAPATQKGNLTQLKNLRAAFDHFGILDVRPMHVRQYLDQRSAKVAANREKALLSHVFTKALDWGSRDDNPCMGIHRNPEKPRTRYVEDWEYQAVFNIASPMIKVAMSIARISGIRQGDIIALKMSEFRKEFLPVTQGKTGNKQLFELSPGLMAAYEQAKVLQGDITSIHQHVICHGRSNRPYTSSGFQTSWQRLMRESMSLGVIVERFTFHDLRAKAGSDTDDTQRLLGQKTASMAATYQRKLKPVKPVE